MRLIVRPVACKALVSDPPHYLHAKPCSRRGRYMVGDYGFCRTHANKMQKRLDIGLNVIVFDGALKVAKDNVL